MAEFSTQRRALRALAHVWVLAALGAGLLSGCSNGSIGGDGSDACVAAEAVTPATARPGQTLEIPIDNLYAGCDDQGEGPDNPVANTVTLELFDGATQATVATATADVDADARAVVELTVPADASGALVFRLDGLTVADVRIVPAA